MRSSRIYTVQYQNIETVIDLVQAHGSNCLMSKADIQDALKSPIYLDLLVLYMIVLHVFGYSLHTGVYASIVYLSTPRSAIGPTISSR
jgi:hypothetical protein